LDVARVVAVGTRYNMHHTLYLDESSLDHIRMTAHLYAYSTQDVNNHRLMLGTTITYL